MMPGPPKAPEDPRTPVEGYLDWYDKRASRARALFLIGRVVELGAATAIPIVALAGGSPLVSAGLGALIAVVAGVEQVFRFQETWINYRQTAEALRTELFLFSSGAGPFAEAPDTITAGQLLATRVADLLMKENARWNSIAERAKLPDLREGAGAAVPPIQ